jgi:hypothetical protein
MPLAVAPGPIGGTLSWRAADLEKDRRWIHYLDDSDIAELERAAEETRSRGIEIIDITREHFPLEALAAKINGMRRDILDTYGFTYLRGLPVARYDRETLTRMYFGLSRHFGDPVAQNRNGHLLSHVIDLGPAENDVNKRLTQTNEELQFHSDACDVVGLLCIRVAQSGGESALVSAAAVHDEILARRPDLWEVLYQPLVIDRRGEVPANKAPWLRMPVFMWHKGVFNGYAPLKQYVESARRFDEAPRMSAQQWEAFNLFLDVCNDPSVCLRVHFEPGDFQFLQNHIVFHSRTAYQDPPDPALKRHLMRIWLSMPDGRELAPVLAERWVNIERGTIRGGVNIPNRKPLTIALEPDTPAYS